MDKVIKAKIYNIYGEPWAWKTIFAEFLASFHQIIWANFEIRLNGKICSNFIKSIDQLDKIPFSNDKQVIVIDEWGVNNNARRSWSDENLEFWRLAMLCRKKNANVIQIAQLERMADVYYRELASASFNMHSWYIWPNRLMFEFDLTINWVPQGSKFVDLFTWKEQTGYEYNTLESGKIDTRIKKGSQMEKFINFNNLQIA